MTDYHYVLTNSDEGIHLSEFEVSSSEGLKLSGSPEWSISRRTLHGGVSEGVDVLDVDNGVLQVSILPTRGMGLWRGELRVDSQYTIPLGWDSPVKRPVHPAFVNQTERNGLGWLAGFNELLCRCGLAFNGPPGFDEETGEALTLHGKIANIPAHYLEVSINSEGNGRLSVTGVVDETSMFGSCLRLTSTLETEAGSNSIRIRDRVTNPAAHASELELLYHTNLGRPFLERGSSIVAPIREVAPRDPRAAEGVETWNQFQKPTADYTEQVYFFDLLTTENKQTQVLLKNCSGQLGVSMKFNRRQLPCFTLWKNTQLEADGYVTGLEPGTNFPNFKAVERSKGRVISLAPGESYETEIELAVLTTVEQINSAEADIVSLQGDVEPKILPQPAE